MTIPISTSVHQFTSDQQFLWENLLAFRFDAKSVSKSFTSRLANENGWSEAFTLRVVHEYRRFLFLTAVAGHSVCPSEYVDSAWHQHLISTNSYWEELCRGVLGYPLHHHQNQGGAEECQKHVAMYRQTLASYRKFFGEDPPSDIWPITADRFDPKSQPRVVNLRDHWIVRKPRWWPSPIRRHTVFAAGIIPFAVGLGPLDLRGQDFLLLYLMLFVITYLGAIVYSRIKRDVPVRDDGDLNHEEIACLTYGRAAAVNATVARMLYDQELICIGTKDRFGKTNGGSVQFSQGSKTPAADQSVACAISQAVNTKRLTLLELQETVAAQTKSIQERLESSGYFLNELQLQELRLVTGGVAFAMLLFGVAKIVVGINRDRPVGFLVIGCIAVFLIFILTFAQLRRTLSGDRMVRFLKTHHNSLKQKLEFPDCSPRDVAISAALFGPVALQGAVFDDFRSAWRAIGGNRGFGNSGSGCGGNAGCGGGGGGCGGGGCGGGGCGGCGG